MKINPYRFMSGAVSIFVAVFFLYALDGMKEELLYHVAIGIIVFETALVTLPFSALFILSENDDKKLIKNMKKTGHYDVLEGEFYQAMDVLFLAAILFMVCLFMKHQFLLIVFSIASAFFTFAIGLLCEALRKFYLVLRILNERKNEK